MRHSYGFDRIETIGALVNVMIMYSATVPLVLHASTKLVEPDLDNPADGRMVFLYGCAAVIVNVILAHAFWNDTSSHSHGNMSARAAKLHVTVRLNLRDLAF